MSGHPSRRTPLPRLWFLSAEERGIDAGAIVPTLPRGVGVIYRDYRRPDRSHRVRELVRLCRRKGLPLLAGGGRVPPGAGIHVPRWSRRPHRTAGPVTMSVHRAGDVRRAMDSRADLFIVAPVFPTFAHPDSRPLGPLRLGLLARALPGPVAALGGITPATVRRLAGLGLYAVGGSSLFSGPGAPGALAGLRVWYGPLARRSRILPVARRFPTDVRIRSRRTRS